MAKTTAKYETVFIIDPAAGEEGVASLTDKFKSLIEQNGTLGEVDEWGKRRLAYPINDLLEGHYVLINFESKPDFPAELDRVYKITEGILRSLIICKDE
ncbi:MAG: 30S ribosomal protein S6 [Oscillospiraceae bacterium]|jgi:small subunit ribosomal protein S6|nr:30S ribosomal protein S6 [Oscillospiraceae bacterium]